jgi:hypothetical protein
MLRICRYAESFSLYHPKRRGRPACLPSISTNEYIRNVKQNGWQPFCKKLWQRGYYEHVIRNEAEWLTAAQYILDNPRKLVINNNLDEGERDLSFR